MIVRRFEETGQVPGGEPVGQRVGGILASGVVLAMVLVAVKSFVSSGGSARPSSPATMEYKRQPLMDDDFDVELSS